MARSPGKLPSESTPESPAFCHPAETLAFWRSGVREALDRGATTPFYLFDPQPMAAVMARMEALNLGRPAVHWYSTKTQPLAASLDWWRRQGRPAEVVSERELRLVREVGYDVENTLINGPAKHRWLPALSQPSMRVHFDSIHELDQLIPLAKKDRWRAGLRICTSEEYDGEVPELPTQFGFTPDEAVSAARRLKRAGIEVESLHFHLRTQVGSADCYARALAEVAQVASTARLSPRFLDVGGGWPAQGTLSRGGKRLDAGFAAEPFALVVRQALKRFPTVEQVWLENGRHVTAASGVLVVAVQDVKERRGLRQLICDGGRTMNALVSIWEQHALHPLERRTGVTCRTAVYGPTCMAFDQMVRRQLPRSIRIGDRLIWFEAGAYHLPWETRFSHGLAEIWWREGDRMERVRAADAP